MTASQFGFALYMTESQGNHEAWGDGGCAVGLYQVHAAWLFEHANKYHVAPLVDERFNDWVARVVSAFYSDWSRTLPQLEVAMFFHRGHQVPPASDEWDGEYANRFARYAALATAITR